MKAEPSQALPVLATPRAPGRLWKGWIGVVIHGTLVFVVGLSLPVLKNPSETLVMGGILSALTYCILGLMEARRAPLFLSPLSFYFFWYAVGLGLSAINAGSVIASGEPFNFGIAVVAPGDVAVGYVVFLAGSVALHAGLHWVRPTHPHHKMANMPDLGRGELGWLVVLWAIGLWAAWNPSWIAPLGALSGILPSSSLAALCAFAITPREKLGLSRGIFALVFAVGIAGLFAVNLSVLSKAQLMVNLLPLLWLFLMRGALRRWLPVTGVIFSAFYLFVVAPAVTLARYERLQGMSHAGDISTFAGVIRQAGTNPVEVASSFFRVRVDEFLSRQFDPSAVGYLVGEVSSYGLQLGSTMAYAGYAFIPRVLWPGKPTVVRAAWFDAYVRFGIPGEEETGSALGMTATGELYWNFGMAGVLLGMFVIGCGLGGLWRMAGIDPRGKPLHMMLYVLVMTNMGNMPEAVTVSSGIVSQFVLFVAAFTIIGMMRAAARGSRAAFAS